MQLLLWYGVLYFLLVLLIRFIHLNIWTPLRIQHHFRKQGITGPGYRVMIGSTGQIKRMYAEAQSKPTSFHPDAVLQKAIPYYNEWSRLYGKTFLYWFGNKPRLAVSDPYIIREALVKTNSSFEKVEFSPIAKLLFAQGLTGLKGVKWAIHRRMANEAFYMEKIKGGVPEVAARTTKMLEKWEESRGGREEFEVEVNKELHDLLADVLSKTIFGGSFEERKRIWTLQNQHLGLFTQAARSVYIPGSRFLPTRFNRLSWRLEKETRELIRALVKTNTNLESSSMSLLSFLASSYKNHNGEEAALPFEEVVDECQSFYFVGKETTANLITWALLLLASNQDWQNKAREEIIHVCGSNGIPSAANLKDLKTMSMIVNETLRLYPPIVLLLRETTQKMKIGGLDIPAKTQMFLAVAAAHLDTEVWGKDAEKFNPLRFQESQKGTPPIFPFGLGPRNCIGQNQALYVAKHVLAMIIQQYSFATSPTYAHSPQLLVSIRPQFGAQILFTKIPKMRV